MKLYNGPDSSVVRGYGLGGGGPGFNPHHDKLSGLHVRPFKVPGGSPCPPPEHTHWAAGLVEDSSSQSNKQKQIVGEVIVKIPI